ncbi:MULTISPECIES: hypothetical protein [Sphingomonas]|uniref:GAF domain-containing protein n=1 Tax=Sphingomonas molluscorum TaxID=418184 RepID=A0ABU8Q975_9SPHN|nr:hypothetical protein [Sphingomonas sp. JUb134]
MSDWIGPTFFSVAILSFLVTLIQSVLRPSIKSLQSKVDLVGESLRTLCDGLMTDLASKLAISHKDDSRASLYVHDGNSHFVLIGRYSPNPVLRKPGRPFYPDDQGCIAKGWQQGWSFENTLGNGANYTRNTEARYGIPTADIVRFAMKSKLLGAHRVDSNGEPIAVVLVESMRQDRFDEQALEAALSQFSTDYAPMLKAFRAYAPTPSIAKASGL